MEVRAAGRRAVNTLAGSTMSSNLVILHFNDVYNVEPRQSPEPVGGAARFATAMKSYQHLRPLVLFSGDAFSPSMCKFQVYKLSYKSIFYICRLFCQLLKRRQLTDLNYACLSKFFFCFKCLELIGIF